MSIQSRLTDNSIAMTQAAAAAAIKRLRCVLS
jgi:hypothetical protein